MNDTTTLASLIPLAQLWNEPDVSPIFPSRTAGEWFVRQRRPALVQHGALVKLGGRWFADKARFPAAVRAIGEKAARDAVSLATA